MKVDFKPKYGTNTIEIPTVNKSYQATEKPIKKDVYGEKITIYNDIPSDGVNPRRFDRFVVGKCLVYNQLTESADGTINKIINAQNVITRDVAHYKSPGEYKQLAQDEREQFYTVSPNDFVVLAEVDDVVTDWLEFEALQKKYKANGFFVTAVNANIFGLNIDNVHIMHA